MIVWCAWGNHKIGEREPYEDQTRTHGCCPDCMRKYFSEYVYREEEIVTCNDSV